MLTNNITSNRQLLGQNTSNETFKPISSCPFCKAVNDINGDCECGGVTVQETYLCYCNDCHNGKSCNDICYLCHDDYCECQCGVYYRCDDYYYHVCDYNSSSGGGGTSSSGGGGTSSSGGGGTSSSGGGGSIPTPTPTPSDETTINITLLPINVFGLYNPNTYRNTWLGFIYPGAIFGLGYDGWGWYVPVINGITSSSITSAASNAISYVNSIYSFDEAACNIGVAYAFNELTCNNSLNGRLANNLVDYWESSSDWEPINISEAQTEANNGSIVVAGTTNLSGSGHVVMIVPGNEVYSSSWNMNVPLAMDAGPSKKWESKGINYSWSSSSKDNITFYKYTGSIDCN